MTLRLNNQGDGRRTELKLLALRIQCLLRQHSGGDGGLVSHARLLQTDDRVFNVYANLADAFLQLKFGLSQGELVGYIVRLGGPVPERNVQRKAHRVVWIIPAEDLPQQVPISTHHEWVRDAAGAIGQRVRTSGQCIVCKVGQSLQRGQQRTLAAGEVNKRALEVDSRLLQLRPFGERLLNQFRIRLEILFLRNLNAVERNNVYVIQPRAGHPIPAQRVLQHRFLLRHVGL